MSNEPDDDFDREMVSAAFQLATALISSLVVRGVLTHAHKRALYNAVLQSGETKSDVMRALLENLRDDK